jgi:hypothetical protein
LSITFAEPPFLVAGLVPSSWECIWNVSGLEWCALRGEYLVVRPMT